MAAAAEESVASPEPTATRDAAGEAPRVLVVLGTRPEAVKLAPVVAALRRRGEVETVVLSTGQHRDLLDQALAPFGIAADEELSLMAPGQGLNALAARAVAALDQAMDRLRPRLVVVQGDTTTAMAAALAAFHRRVPVAHVEAGLRSGDLGEPFPEEANRRVVSLLAALHLAPTEGAARRLLAEGTDPRRVVVTGNTVVDALARILAEPFSPAGTPLAGLPPSGARLVLVTAHRRESFGEPLAEICRALRELAERFPDVLFCYPVHPNPEVREPVARLLGGVRGVRLLPPLGYREFLHLMQASEIVLTDSGGVQEEAPTLGKPVLLLRRLTERPEAFEAGVAKVVGWRPEDVVREASRLLADEDARRAMVARGNPYGDGRAGERCAEAIGRWLAGIEPLLPPGRELVFEAPQAPGTMAP